MPLALPVSAPPMPPPMQDSMTRMLLPLVSTPTAHASASSPKSSKIGGTLNSREGRVPADTHILAGLQPLAGRAPFSLRP